MGRAIGTDRILIIAHVDEDMRMIERRQGTDAHEFLGANAHLRDTRLIVEMRRSVVGHDENQDDENQDDKKQDDMNASPRSAPRRLARA
jgi:hypothetical protein